MSADCGCGCGGSKAAQPAGGCGCGGGESAAPAGTGFVRPRFFGGMLLTEDDLQAAIDYTVAKRRLTNRHVIGAGVVCGLDVTADPCDPRVVVVSPGYAIECCGNDILVSCPEEVNIIDLVRDLRRRTGVDCGEPCDKQPHQEYHLYIRYAEAPSAPVAPYAPDDCATGDCEFSRISEGYRFELRCACPEDVETLFAALRRCKPRNDVVKNATEQMTTALSLVSRRAEIAERLAGGEPVLKAPTASEFRKVLVDPDHPEAGIELAAGVALVGRSLAVLAHDAAPDLPAGGATRAPDRRQLVERMVDLAGRLRTSPELKAQAPEEQARILRVLETARERPDLSVLSAVDRGWLEVGTSTSDAEARFITSAEAVRGAVLEQLAGRGASGSEDYRAVSAMRFTALSDASGHEAKRLAGAYLRLVDECTCTAFNPPCPTCTDDAVALAKVCVDGCDVVDVCALDRRWVLSPRALSYWFPVVEALREELEEVCCGERRGRGDGSAYDVARGALGRLEAQLQETRGEADTRRRLEQLELQLDALTQKEQPA